MLRWVLGILILVVVFWMGVQVGEFRTAFGYSYGMWPGMMGNNYYGATPYPYGYPMMGGYYYGGQTAGPSQSTTTTAPTYYYGPGGMMQGYYQNAPQTTSAK